MARHVATRQVTVQKIQSHQKEQPTGTQEHEQWQGNARADLLATQALRAERIKHELEYNKKLYDNQVQMVKFVGAIHEYLAQNGWDYEWPELEQSSETQSTERERRTVSRLPWKPPQWLHTMVEQAMQRYPEL
eukprot:4719309-Amphidinium_carterae.1